MRVFLGAFAKLGKATISFVVSVRPSVSPHGTTRPAPGRIFMKFDIWVFFETPGKFKFHQNMIRITDTLHEDLCTLTISR
jgi:hypothetical protein